MTSTEQVNKSNEEEIKKLYELSKPEPGELKFRVDGSIWKNGNPIAEEPSYEEKAWFARRMRGPVRSWEVCDQ
jgi:hypothetical protein